MQPVQLLSTHRTIAAPYGRRRKKRHRHLKRAVAGARTLSSQLWKLIYAEVRLVHLVVGTYSWSEVAARNMTYMCNTRPITWEPINVGRKVAEVVIAYIYLRNIDAIKSPLVRLSDRTRSGIIRISQWNMPLRITMHPHAGS